MDSDGQRGRRRFWTAIVAVFLISALFHAAIEARHGDLFGVDGYYHIKIAEMYRTGECAIFGGDFRWATFSSYNDLRHDWQLGYHLALIPFTFFDLVFAAKLSVVVFTALLTTTVYGLLRAHGAWGAASLALVFEAASTYLLWQHHFPRPTTLFLVAFLLTAHAIATRRAIWAGVGVFAAMAVYNVPQSLIALSGLGLLLLTWDDRKIPLKMAGCLLLGMIVGVIAHPGFWHWRGSFFGLDHGTFVLWNQIQGTLAAALDGDRVLIDGQPHPIHTPTEFLAPGGRMMWEDFRLPLALVGTTLLLQTRKLCSVNLAARLFMAMAVVYFYLFLDARRFAEYWIPFAVVGCGIGVYQWLEVNQGLLGISRYGPPLGRQGALLNRIATAAVVAEILYLLAVTGSGGRWTDWMPAYLALGCWTLRLLLPLHLQARATTRDDADPRFTRLIGLGSISFVAVLGCQAIGNLAEGLRKWPLDLHISQNYQGAASWLQANAEPEELVFHTDWDDFAPLFFFNSKNHYMVSFDPYFFYQHDPRQYARWFQASHGKLPPDATDGIIRGFGSRYVFITKEPRFRELANMLVARKGYRMVHDDDWSVLFAVEGP
jgi:hypothetical protein